MGKVHGSLARAGKVRGQTPKVAKQDKKKKPRGRAHKRMQYNRRFVTAGNNWLHDVKGFQFFTRKLANMCQQLKGLFLITKLSLIREVLRFTSSTIGSMLTRGINKVPARRYCL
ncbi:uncharacterized protein LOC122300983 isoform X1 [Carya illinoinensis]|uniref:uncharacterized protein LOC122300983 isoform X1 n=1 Tax=Carya illinoinensis TaxID=32201 RepID=UPI001C7280AA|nr:uncharacterized protein LOC122300983 isoform X1 [Carya illinoinensis]